MDQHPTSSDQGLFDHHHDMQREIIAIETKRVRNKLLTIAAIMFASDLLGLMMKDMFTVELLLWSLLIPAVLGGLAFLALKEPMTAMIIAAIIIAALWIYVIAVVGAMGAISGFIVKILIIYLIIAGFQSAREVQRVKREYPV